MVLHEKIRLHSSSEHFVFESLVPKEGDKLVINRHTGHISTSHDVKGYNPEATVEDIRGILGIVRLLAGPYLIVITESKSIGKINGSEIFKISKTKLIPFEKPNISGWQYEDEVRYKKMIETVLSIDGIYFSYSYDLTHSMQRQSQMSHAHEHTHAPLHSRVEHRYWWNRGLVQDFVTANLDAWVLPIMMGFVEIKSSSINGHNFDFIVIARRNAKRVGTRYFVRGVDKEGNVANAVETEQIILQNGVATSLVQTRGSIPLFWRQTPSLKYKPKLEIYGSEIETPPAFRRHFEDLSKRYNRVVAINLIDQKGSELLLGNAYEKEARKHSELKYIAFDFHRQCRGMRYDKLSLLMDQITDDVEKNGYFYSDNGTVRKLQEGVFRTNCIDNLDRTNVVQSLIARQSLSDQFVNHKIFANRSDTIANYPEFDRIFKNVWANHADTISLQYSGTGALKTDFTRTGKRTIQGALNDGVNSITRYYYNNFTDGFRQDAFDLFLGNYVPTATDRTPFKKPVLDLVKVVSIAVGVFILGLMLPHEHKLLFSVSFCLIAIAGARVATVFGKKFVNKPSLYLKEHDN